MDPKNSRAMYLESIRGIGAVQVLFLHCMVAFVPELTGFDQNQDVFNAIHKSPLFLFYDGYTAVYLFFILSGIVLTFHFGAGAPRPSYILPRITRLMIPAAAAVLLGAVLKGIFGSVNVEAGAVLNSTGLKTLWLPPDGAGFVLKDAFVDAPWLGYGPSSTWSWLKTGIAVDPMSVAYSAPLWTLSIELHGSVMLLLLCMLYRWRPRLWSAAMIVLAVLLLRSHFLCFLVGHLIGVAMLKERRQWNLHPLVCIALIDVGLYLCISEELGPNSVFAAICRPTALPILPCLDHTQKIYGSMFLFSGLFFSKAIRDALENKISCYFGKISFSLYLIHWPIVFGLGSALFLALTPRLSTGLAVAITLGCVVPICVGAAHLFSKIDGFAIRLARRWRRAIDAAP